MVAETLIAAIAAAQRRQAETAARANDPKAFLRSFAALRARTAQAQGADGAPAAPPADAQGVVEEDDGEPARLPDIPTVPAAHGASRRTKGRGR